MSILYKDEYLEKLKNEMLFHFSHQDIHITLEDTSLFFESGMADGKTEAELCNELGTPKELAHGLSPDKSSNSLRYAFLCIHIISCFILLLLAFRYPGLLLSMISLIIIPISIWHLEGGCCLLQIRADTAKHYKAYSLFLLISLMIISTEQIFTILLKNNISISIPIIKATSYMSSILIILSIAIFIISIYKLNKGYYLSYGILIISIGVICSSLLYNDFLKRFSSPTVSYLICSLPFALSLIMGMLYSWYILKKKDKNLWIHR